MQLLAFFCTAKTVIVWNVCQWLVWGSVDSVKVQIGLAWPWSDCPRSRSKLVTNRSDIPQPRKGSSVSGPFLGRIYQQQQLGARKCPEPDSGLNTSICHLKPLLSLLWKNFPYLGKHQQLQAESCKVVKGEFWLLNIDRQHWTWLRRNGDFISLQLNQSFERNPEQSIVYSCINNWFCFGWWPMWGASITAKKYKFSWFFVDTSFMWL